MIDIRFFFFFFKQKTAYEMRISDWSSDVCSSDLQCRGDGDDQVGLQADQRGDGADAQDIGEQLAAETGEARRQVHHGAARPQIDGEDQAADTVIGDHGIGAAGNAELRQRTPAEDQRSEEHTSELQSLMRNSYAVFCLKKKKK